MGGFSLYVGTKFHTSDHDRFIQVLLISAQLRLAASVIRELTNDGSVPDVLILLSLNAATQI